MWRYMTIDTRPGIGYIGLVEVLNAKAKQTPSWEFAWMKEEIDPPTFSTPGGGIFYRLILRARI